MSERVCRRCLLKDMDRNEYFRSIYEYIENIPQEQKAEPSIYESRVNICRSCDHLVNGMCELCGCFVEVRAAKIMQHCAKSSDIW